MKRSITRRFNYTKRIEIPHTAVEIDIKKTEEGPPSVVVMRLTLPDRGTHAQMEWQEARVIFEAWRTDIGVFQRFDIGSVAQVTIKTPVWAEVLHQFPNEHNLTFRIKLVAADSKLILAEADRLKASQEEWRKDELIHVIPEDLGELPWTIDWSDIDEGPKILVNSKIDQHRQLLTEGPVARGLVMSAVLREVLHRVFETPETREEEWAGRWLTFGARFTDQEAPAEKDEADHWIRAVLAGFAAKHRLSTDIDTYFTKRDNEVAA